MTQDDCEKKFADLFLEMLEVKTEEEEEEDEEDEDEEDEEKKGKWAVLSEEEVKKYFVASIDNSVANDGSVRFKMVGLALREKQMVPDAEAAPGTDIYLKAPKFGGALKRAALPTLKWWRSHVEEASGIL